MLVQKCDHVVHSHLVALLSNGETLFVTRVKPLRVLDGTELRPSILRHDEDLDGHRPEELKISCNSSGNVGLSPSWHTAESKRELVSSNRKN